MILTGAPKTVLEVNDKSIIKDTPLAGIVIVQGPTKRGKIGTAHFIGNTLQYLRKLGGEFTDGTSKFPAYCNRILNAGGKLWVIRAGHYTAPADKSTLVGTKSTATITVAANNSIWRGEEVGTGYDGTTVTIVNAASGDVAKKDITIRLKDSDLDIEIADVKRVMTVAEISDFNALLRGKDAGVELVSIATQIENGVGTFAGGAQVVSAIVPADYTGTAAGSNGWYVADKVTDAMRIANIGLPGDEAVDDGMRLYSKLRGDLIYYRATPLGVNAAGMGSYRDGTTPYTVLAHDEWIGRLVGADVNITDSVNRDLKFDIPGLVDSLTQRLICDQKFGPWISSAGPQRGRVISPNNGVPLNLSSPALATDFDTIYKKGVNAVVEDADYGTVYWGNKSLYKNPNSLLSKENVGDLIVYIIRGLKPLVRWQSFDPNDPRMWKQMYRRVKPFIDDLESNRAITPGEDQFWFWQGDQNADVRTDAKFNALADLDAGKYRARFVFVPITATEYIGIEIVPTDSNSVKFVVQENVIL